MFWNVVLNAGFLAKDRELQGLANNFGELIGDLGQFKIIGPIVNLL